MTSSDYNKAAKRQATEACARALLVSESRGFNPVGLQDHPLAQSMVQSESMPSFAPTWLRGWNDSNAFLHAYHDRAVHMALRPENEFIATLFDVMEYERCLSVGASHYRGAASNIVKLKQLPKSKAAAMSNHQQIIQQISVLVRDALGHEVARFAITQHPEVQRLASSFAQSQDTLRQCQTNQQAFAKLALSILALLDLQYDKKDSAQAVASDEPAAEEQQSDGSFMSGSSDQAEGRSSESLIDEIDHSPSLVLEHENSDELRADQQHALDEVASVSSVSGESSPQLQQGASYKAYSTQADEIVDAAKLELTNDIETYRAQLDVFIQKHGSIVNRLSARLRQLLLARQRSSWVFDLEEGVLDTSRLNRVVTTPSQPLSFKAEQDSLFKDTIVCLLIDNSKSMVGKPIATAAACADILAQTLERCGVAVEILGFTTTELHASELLLQWQSEGSYQSPGRMNGLRHIIYKSASTPFRRARINLGAMLDRQLLKQNIDGEALLWAYGRLRLQPQTRKLLIVISDGAPLDASTLTANSKNYLGMHLHQSIAKVENDNQIELSAIGINHDVSHYYQNAISIHDARDLGKALLQQLSELFKP